MWKRIAIEFAAVGFAYGAKEVLRGVSFTVKGGQFVGIVGPNGAGKSTVLKLMDRLLSPSTGEVRIMGRDIAGYTLSELARLVALIPQEPEYFPFTVREMVRLGRTPYRRGFSPFSARDEEIVEQSMQEAGVLD